MKKLSVIIPVFNERMRIVNTLEKIITFLRAQNYSYEIIVVDDGSTDNTASTIKKYVETGEIILIRKDANHGKGFAVRTGVMKAEGEYILFSDADLSTPIEEVDKIFEQMLKNDADIAIASRAMKDSQIMIHQPFYREYMGKIFNKIARIFTFSGIYDSQCGFKLFRKSAAKKLFAMGKIDGFAFDVEVLFLAQKCGYSVAELPVRWQNCPNTRVDAIKDSFAMFIDVIRIRMNYLRRIYR